MEHEGLRLLQHHVHEAGGESLLALALQRLAADEVGVLPERDGEAQPGFERGLRLGDVVAPVAVALLAPERIHRVDAAEPDAEVGASLHQPVEDRHDVLGRDVQLPAQLADIGDPHRPCVRVADIDLAAGAEGKGRVGEVGVADPFEQCPGVGPHHGEHAGARGHIGHVNLRAIAQVPLDPGEVAGLRGRRRHHQIAIVREPGDGEVRLDPAPLVEELRVDDLARRHGDIVGAEALQLALRIRSLHQVFGEEAHVEDADRVAHGAVLLPHAIEPVLLAPGVFVSGLDACGREPVGALPPRRLAEAGVVGGEARVQRAEPHRARGLHLPMRPVHLEEQTQALPRAIGQIAAVVLESGKAGDIELGEVHRRLPLDDPFRYHLAGAGGAEDPLAVEAGGNEEARELRRLSQHELVVRGEALGPVHELADGRLLKHRQELDRVGHRKLEMVPVLRQLDELGAGRHLVQRQRLGHGLEAADEEPARVLLHIDVAVGVADDRRVGESPSIGSVTTYMCSAA